jgi:hypothetical protein
MTERTDILEEIKGLKAKHPNRTFYTLSHCELTELIERLEMAGAAVQSLTEQVRLKY